MTRLIKPNYVLQYIYQIRELKNLDFLSSLVQEAITILYNISASFGFANYGFAIILLTVIVKMATYPLTKKQIQSMKAMQRLQA